MKKNRKSKNQKTRGSEEMATKLYFLNVPGFPEGKKKLNSETKNLTTLSNMVSSCSSKQNQLERSH